MLILSPSSPRCCGSPELHADPGHLAQSQLEWAGREERRSHRYIHFPSRVTLTVMRERQCVRGCVCLSSAERERSRAAASRRNWDWEIFVVHCFLTTSFSEPGTCAHTGQLLYLIVVCFIRQPLPRPPELIRHQIYQCSSETTQHLSENNTTSYIKHTLQTKNRTVASPKSSANKIKSVTSKAPLPRTQLFYKWIRERKWRKRKRFTAFKSSYSIKRNKTSQKHFCSWGRPLDVCIVQKTPTQHLSSCTSNDRCVTCCCKPATGQLSSQSSVYALINLALAPNNDPNWWVAS